MVKCLGEEALRRRSEQGLPLSSVQTTVWLYQLLNPESTQYNIGIADEPLCRAVATSEDEVATLLRAKRGETGC